MAAPRGRQITNFGGFFDPFAIGTGTPRTHRRIYLSARASQPGLAAAEQQPGLTGAALAPALSASAAQPGLTSEAGRPGIDATADE